MKTTFIATIFNEEKTIERFFISLASQTKLPDEIIIVDGGSSDQTVAKIKNQKSKIKNFKGKFVVLTKKGNRSVGRNEAIKHATGDIILCSDAGNILDKDWTKNIIKPFEESDTDVVAGYYKGKAKNIFQKCLIPYVLVMPDKLDENNFLPVTRSMAFKKSIWKKLGGFPEEYSHNEDYVFAKRLKQMNIKIVFAKDAVVYWIPRKTYKEAFIMFFRFALGDAEAAIFRSKVMLLFLRYFLGFYLIYLSIFYKSFIIFCALLALILLYAIWSIKKNYKYVKDSKALNILPRLQFTADISVILGTLAGLMKRMILKIRQNKILSLLILIYCSFVLSVLSWGTPNIYHPFTYHMDEWHQLMAIEAIVKHGTTTVSGSAEIPFVYPVLSAIYLIPFMLFHIVDPFILKSPLEDMMMQQRLFEVLRSVNIIFGIGSALLIVKIAKKYLKIDYIIPVFFFIISPSLLLLSTYFKYDIGLLFWITLSLSLLFNFGTKPALKNFVIASISSGIAMGTKFSAIPLLPLLVLTFFLFMPRAFKKLKHLFIGLFFYVATFIIVGIPNLFIGKANYQGLLQSNIADAPNATSNVILPSPWWIYLFTTQFPLLFGHSLFILGSISFFYLLFVLIFKKRWRIAEYKNEVFLIVGFILFLASLIQLQLGATNNRALVLLPFLVLISGIFINVLSKKLKSYNKLSLHTIIILFMTFQAYQVGAWIYLKYRVDIQIESSVWIEKNIPKGQTIGIENIPIYQYLPNIILKEFYLNQYEKKGNNLYRYEVIDHKSIKLPSTIVVSDDDIYKKLFFQSPKKELIRRLEAEGYRKEEIFTPEETLIKFFAKDIDYYVASIAVTPNSITIYKK